jgi:hypothetical protein
MLWWIGDLVLLVIVFPVVVALESWVLAAIERIRYACDEILRRGVILTGLLDNLPENLATTDRTVEEVAIGAVRYAGSVGKLLG